MKTSAILAMLLFAACGDDLKSNATVDAPKTGGHSFKVSGTATTQNLDMTTTAAAGVTVEAFANADAETSVGSATTGADGTYEMTVTIDGTSLEGFIKGTKTGNVDTYLFPPGPISADFAGANLNELANQTFGVIRSLGMGAAGQAVIALEVVDSAGAPVAGAVVTADPAAAHVGYSAGCPGVPICLTATETAADGRAFLFGNAAGDITLSATATGHTFNDTTLDARADVFTTTLVSE